MTPLAFVSPFIGRRLSLHRVCHPLSPCCRPRRVSRQHITVHLLKAQLQTDQRGHGNEVAKPKRLIGIVGKAKIEKEASVEIDPNQQKGLFGVKAKAYWDSMGILPLFFAGFGVVALAIKMVKVKGGEWTSGPNGVNKVTIPKTAITTEEEEAELHVFKCGGCGYEMYPARGRESVFFPDSFKCPLCKTPKSEFWDLNDPTDPRNHVSNDEDEEDDTVTEVGGNGSTSPSPAEHQEENTEAETTAKDLTEPDSSS